MRSLGGWSAIKKLRLNDQDRIKGDERISGDGEFVAALEIYSKSRRKVQVEARDLLCYWAVREYGCPPCTSS